MEELNSITGEIKENLLRHGINTVYKLSRTPKVKLEEIEIDSASAETLLSEAFKLKEKYKSLYYTKEDEEKFLTTGCKALDNILGGGCVNIE